MNTALKITSGQATLNVRIDGEPGLPWAILSNSLASDLTMWDDQMAALTKLRRVVRYDTRGHGASSPAPGLYDFPMLTGDVIAILDHLEIAAADVLGLSLGGMTALGLGLDHPARVRKLICCDARASFPAPAIAAWDDRIKAVTAGGMAAVVEETLPRWFTEAGRRDRPDLAARARAMMLATSVAGYCSCAAALKTLNYFNRLPAMTRPTLYICGDADPGSPPDAMREMAAATPGAGFALIPNAAHIANMENVPEFNRVVCGFLQG